MEPLKRSEKEQRGLWYSQNWEVLIYLYANIKTIFIFNSVLSFDSQPQFLRLRVLWEPETIFFLGGGEKILLCTRASGIVGLKLMTSKASSLLYCKVTAEIRELGSWEHSKMPFHPSCPAESALGSGGFPSWRFQCQEDPCPTRHHHISFYF